MQKPSFLFTIAAIFPFLVQAESIPSTQTPSCHGWNLDIQADWLYWKANETGLCYALNQDFFRISNPISLGCGEAAHPHFDWGSGFRVGSGYTIPHGKWDLSLLWTWNEGKGSNSQYSHNDHAPTIFPIFIHPNVDNDQSIIACMEASDQSLIHLNIIDLDLGKQCKEEKWFFLRPHGGLRSVWINQIHDVNYKDLFDRTGKQVLENYHTHMTNKFWGLGIRGGLEANFVLGWGFSIIGDASLSLLYGLFKTSYAERFNIDRYLEGTIIAEDNNYHSENMVFDAKLGMRWQHSFAKERFRLSLQTAWEHLMFPSQNQLMRFVDGQNLGSFVQNQGDISFQGWTASLCFFF